MPFGARCSFANVAAEARPSNVPAIVSFVPLSVAVTDPTPVTFGEAAATGTGDSRPRYAGAAWAVTKAGDTAIATAVSNANRFMSRDLIADAGFPAGRGFPDTIACAFSPEISTLEPKRRARPAAGLVRRLRQPQRTAGNGQLGAGRRH